MRKLRIHCFQQVGVEGLGCILDWINEKGHCLAYTRFYEAPLVPSVDDFDALVVMGGPMSVYEEDKYPWLVEETRVIREAMEAGIPVLGICLGSQFMAAALGAQVYAGDNKEIGWFEVNLSESGKSSVLGKLDGAKVFHWHGDTFEVPEGAKLLAFSEATPHQAFLYGANALALQFHLEVNAKSVDGMVSTFSSELQECEFVQSADAILAQKEQLTNNNKLMFDILDQLFV